MKFDGRFVYLPWGCLGAPNAVFTFVFSYRILELAFIVDSVLLATSVRASQEKRKTPSDRPNNWSGQPSEWKWPVEAKEKQRTRSASHTHLAQRGL